MAVGRSFDARQSAERASFAAASETGMIAPMKNGTPSHSPTPLCASRWRRACVVALFACLAILQGLAPLLHVHLEPGSENIAGMVWPGVHLPVSLAHAGHRAPGVRADCADRDDSAVITAPSELKRDEPLSVDAMIGLSPGPFLPPATTLPGPDVAGSEPPPIGRPHLRPPALAPPTSPA